MRSEKEVGGEGWRWLGKELLVEGRPKVAGGEGRRPSMGHDVVRHSE
jgi:hypothetical protein